MSISIKIGLLSSIQSRVLERYRNSSWETMPRNLPEIWVLSGVLNYYQGIFVSDIICIYYTHIVKTLHIIYMFWSLLIKSIINDLFTGFFFCLPLNQSGQYFCSYEMPVIHEYLAVVYCIKMSYLLHYNFGNGFMNEENFSILGVFETENVHNKYNLLCKIFG